MTPHVSEEFSATLVDWSLLALGSNTMPPRDPDDDEDDEDDEDEDDEDEDEPPVVREPDED
jgi:hypothetical protein